MNGNFREVGLRELPEDDLSRLKKVQEQLELSGPFVGGLIGNNAPSKGLVLVGNETWLLRVHTIPASASAVALQYFTKLSRHFPNEVRCKLQGTNLYYGRRYYRNRLIDLSSRAFQALEGQSQAARAILHAVAKLHKYGLFHGDITSENLFRDGTKVFLTDAGVRVFVDRESGRFHALSDAAEKLQREDQRMFIDLINANFEKLSVKGIESYLGSEAFFRKLDNQFASLSPSKSKENSSLGGESHTGSVSRMNSEPRGNGESRSKGGLRDPRERKPSGPHPPSQGHVQVSSKTSSSWAIPVLLLVILFGGVAYRYQESIEDLVGIFSPENLDQFRADWVSQDPVRMLAVAKAAALQGNRGAQEVILEGVVKGQTDSRLLLSEPLLIAARSPWYQEFSKADRAALYALVLAPLLKDQVATLPDLTVLHPGIVLALLGGLPDEKDPTKLVVLIQRLSDKLPSPFQEALDRLEKEKQSNFPFVFRAYTRLVTGDPSMESLETYFPESSPLSTLTSRLALLVPTLTEKDAEVVWQYLKASSIGSPLVNWFDEYSPAEWKSLNSLQKLAASFSPEVWKVLTVQQLADLSRSDFVSTEAKQRLLKLLEKGIQKEDLSEFLVVLTQHPAFSREQTISLALAVEAKGEPQHAFIDRWFETKPDPSAVMMLLLSLSESRPFEAFSVPAARYVKAKKGWKLNAEEVSRLANHPEPLARGLAYSQLSANDPKQRNILNERLKVETSKSLRKLLQSKLSS